MELSFRNIVPVLSPSFEGSCGSASLSVFKLTIGSAVMGNGQGRDGEPGAECGDVMGSVGLTT